MRIPLRTIAGLALAGGLTACGQWPLQPPAAWERGLLARPDMRIEGDPLQERFDQHIHVSKENASGGSSIGGGGCGCN